MTSGLVQTDGQAQPYDMADTSSADSLIDQNILYWENQLTETDPCSTPVHARLCWILHSVRSHPLPADAQDLSTAVFSLFG